MNKKIRYKIDRSEFIAFEEVCKDFGKIQKILKMYKKEYHDARQICYGGIIDETEIWSDDKEPKGTAGVEILNELKKNKIKNTLIIVVRYFGGKKLGRECLRKTYSKISKMALENIGKKNV